MYFMPKRDPENKEFLGWCDRIEELVQGYTTIQYIAIKLATTGRVSLLPSIYQHLDRIDEIEREIKLGLEKLYLQWRDASVLQGTGGGKR